MIMHKNLNVALFIGNDITSHLIASKTALDLLNKGHNPCLIYVHKDPNRKALADLKQLEFWERTVWHTVLFPQISKLNISTSEYLTPQQWQAKIMVATVDNVNSTGLLDFLKAENISVGVSLRCYQKFGPDIIQYFQAIEPYKGLNFVNLHPGFLPNYRGVLTFAHAMLNKDIAAGFTLHSIDQNWDAGPILGQTDLNLDYSSCVISNMINHVEPATELLISHIEKIANKIQILAKKQNQKQAKYYTHMTQTELSRFAEQKLTLMEADKLASKILNDYFGLTKRQAKTSLEIVQNKFN